MTVSQRSDSGSGAPCGRLAHRPYAQLEAVPSALPHTATGLSTRRPKRCDDGPRADPAGPERRRSRPAAGSPLTGRQSLRRAFGLELLYRGAGVVGRAAMTGRRLTLCWATATTAGRTARTMVRATKCFRIRALARAASSATCVESVQAHHIDAAQRRAGQTVNDSVAHTHNGNRRSLGVAHRRIALKQIGSACLSTPIAR